MSLDADATPLSSVAGTSESIWLGSVPSSYAQVEILVAELWPPEAEVLGRDCGQGGKTLRLHGAGPAFTSVGLQKFALALAGNLRYQTVEIFVSRPVQDGESAAPVLVAAAYRQDGSVFGRYKKRVGRKDNRRRHPWKWRGATDLSDSRLKPLRRLLLSGENARDVMLRMSAYERNEEKDIDLIEFVDYVAAATAVATLTRKGPSDIEGPGPVLWDIAKGSLGNSLGGGSKGFPSQAVRIAMRYLTEAYGDLLLEDEDRERDLGTRAREIAASDDVSPVVRPSAAHFDEAESLWRAISGGVQDISSALRSLVGSGNLPTSAVRLLFEAPVRSYPAWLRSATRTVEEHASPVVHGDLHSEAMASRGRRNKPVNYLTLDAYEKGARAILIDDDTRGEPRPALKSMVLFPFQVRSAHGFGAHGFLRVMNRFSGRGSMRRFFNYKETDGGWSLSNEEVHLGLAVTRLLREKVVQLGIMPLLPKQHIGDSPTGPADEYPLPEERGQVAVAPAKPGSKDDVALISEHLQGRGWRTPQRWRDHGIVGCSDRMVRVYDRLDACANSPGTTICIEGPTGSGKELVARAIHSNSPNRSKPFITIHCAAIPENLIESELFGHEKGAYTGAHDRRKGRFEEANGGTVLLDEVADIPPPAQVKLLRVLQQRCISRLGSSHEIQIDVRVIGATNRPLRQVVAEHTFREDLYYRLNVVEVDLPPLDKRHSDIVELVGWILLHHKRKGATVTVPSSEFLTALVDYEWPGNVRQLENVLERALVLAGGQPLGTQHLPDHILGNRS